MKHYKLFISAVLLLGLIFTGFQCSSSGVTSAKLYIQQKNYEKAKEVLEAELKENPKNDEAYYYLGLVNGEMGNMEEMAANFDQALQVSNQFAEDIDKARTYFYQNLFNKGVVYLQRGMNTTDPDSARVYFDKSIPEFQSAILVRPDSANAHKNLAFAYMSKEDNDAAIAPLLRLIELENEPDGYRFLGQIYYVKATNLKNQGQEETAKEYFNKAIEILEQGRKLYPDNTDMLVILSNSYIGAEKIDVAIDAFKAGVEREPENKYYRYNYGVLLLGAEDFEDAETQFKKAIEIDPEYLNAVYNLGVTYVKWGSKMNKEADAKGELSEAYKEKYQLALNYLERAVEIDKQDTESWELLGKVYAILGMQDDANNAFETAEKIRSGN